MDFNHNKTEYNHKSIVDKYTQAVDEIGLWKSEKIIFDKYIKTNDRILDIGCGAGRTTFDFFQSGHTRITGLDLSLEMINACKEIAKNKSLKISFICASTTELPFESDSFDACVFSFNGLMTIPLKENRLKAMKEISRILKKGGKFIFTTHDINNPDFIEYWKAEKVKWDSGNQDKRLHEFGDLIFTKPEEYGDAISFVHVPSYEEIYAYIEHSNMKLIFTDTRNNIADESKAVKDFSVDCKFWVVEKVW